MKRVIAAALLCALLCGVGTGCGGIFNRSYSSVTPHQEQAASDEDAAVLRAENYADLVSCVQHFVSMGQATGTVHVYKYSGDIEADLEAAAAEVLTEDPLGAYALKNIEYRYSRIVSYYECSFDFTYRRTREDMASIVSAYGTAAIRNLLQQTMANFNYTLTIRTSSYYVDQSSLHALAREAYYSSPATALGYPGIAISVYPETGNTRIVEINFTYDYLNRETMLQWSQEVTAAAAQMAGQDTAADRNVAWQLCSRLADNTDFNPEGSSSVYSALCQGQADSEGIALAYLLLCRQANIPCQLVQGTLDGVPHWWNLITLEDVSWQLDVTSGDGAEGFLHTDGEMEASGYNWSREDYPVCAGVTDGGEASET